MKKLCGEQQAGKREAGFVNAKRREAEYFNASEISAGICAAVRSGDEA